MSNAGIPALPTQLIKTSEKGRGSYIHSDKQPTKHSCMQWLRHDLAFSFRGVHKPLGTQGQLTQGPMCRLSVHILHSDTMMLQEDVSLCLCTVPFARADCSYGICTAMVAQDRMLGACT